MATVSIEAKQGIYLHYRNYQYTAPQVFGEYIDNAIQSSEDQKLQLTSGCPEYQLRVDISIDWYYDPKDKIKKAKSVTIHDNAAGMNGETFSRAFNLADDSVTRKGMNEFGVGMKAASCWLGNKWHIESTSIEDGITRTLDVNLTEVAKNQIKSLESKDLKDPTKKHGTKITISELWPENVIKEDSVRALIKNIASIYRCFIRNHEIQIYFGDQLLTFDEYPPLKAPWYKEPDGEVIEWKKNVTIDDHQGHKVSGFVGLLRDMSDENRGVVFTRNRRVVLGFDPEDRTVGKSFMGQIGSRKYRRVYGELEITGLRVTFGKNQLSDPDLLEALCASVAGKLKINGYSLLTQGDRYTKRITQSKPVQPKPSPEQQTTLSPAPANIETVKVQPIQPIVDLTIPEKTPASYSTNIFSSSSFSYDGKTYTLDVVEGKESSELFWNDLSQINENKLICKVNTSHKFFLVHGSPSDSVVALFKALSIAKYMSVEAGSDASYMMNKFNEIINALK